ncbi:DUF3313 domain-containing protein [Corallincola platygyrae]|uniref:DUF3313 domain-containing protein n=1 Tax=Corallincola platygyrae TaxID=1193278 RepID=A0ABW4XQX4_9GAMM
MKRTLQLTLCIVSSVLFASGCASAPDLEKSHSGFLSSYNKLETVEDDKNQLRYKKSSLKLADFDYIQVEEPTSLIADSLALDSNISVEDQKILADYFSDQVHTQIGKEIDLPGSGNPLLLRSAFTGITNTSEDLAFYQYIPVALVITGIKEAAGKRDKVPMMFMEFELTDQVTGEVLVQSMKRVPLEEITAEELEQQGVGAILPKIDLAIATFKQSVEAQVKAIEG